VGFEETGIKLDKMNWASTQIPLYLIDCDEFRKVGNRLNFEM
jgi:hypothetical protein